MVIRTNSCEIFLNDGQFGGDNGRAADPGRSRVLPFLGIYNNSGACLIKAVAITGQVVPLMMRFVHRAAGEAGSKTGNYPPVMIAASWLMSLLATFYGPQGASRA